MLSFLDILKGVAVGFTSVGSLFIPSQLVQPTQLTSVPKELPKPDASAYIEEATSSSSNILHESISSTRTENTYLPFESTMRKERSEKAKLSIGEQEFSVILADTDALREHGLSDSASIGARQTMLFSFDQPGKYSFWMKDMNYPIDMVWLNKEGKIIYIVHGAPPESFPEVFAPASNDSIAVLELKSGTMQSLHVNVGDSVYFISAKK